MVSALSDTRSDTQTARELYDRIRRDSGYGLAPYRTVQFIAQMMGRDPLAVLHAIGFERVAADDAAGPIGYRSDTRVSSEKNDDR
jgi:hypothetical protein